MAKPVLYSYYNSSASWRVRIALAHKGIEYEYRPVPLNENKQKMAEYLTLNPLGQVPSLVVNGVALTQSMAIIEYLEEAHPEKALLPKDAPQRARVRQIAQIINSGIQPLQNRSNVLKRVAEMTEVKDVKEEWAKHYITVGLKAVEQILRETAATYCVGDEMTVADVFLVPQVFNASIYKVDMRQFPTVQRVYDTLVKLEAFKSADPLQQPDCPEDLKQTK